FKDDALRIAFCGTTGPMPDARRAKICTMVIAGGKFYIVDIGPEATEVISSWRVPMTRLGGLFITHLHSDHIGELGEFNLQSWAQGRDKPLSVYGPPGVERVVNGFAAAYELDRDYRIAHHGAEMMSADNWVMNPVAVPLEGMITPTRERRATMLKDGDLTVTAIEVNHSPIEPAYAYRFDYKGRSVVISGDTSKHFGLAEASKGADVLVHEAQAKHVIEIMIGAAKEANNERLRKIFSDIQNYHTSPVEAAEIANVAGVKLLVLHHFTPPPNNPILGWSFLRGVSAVRSRGVVMADDHMLITVPLSGDAKPKVGRMN
ncbi:MAG TPA: MBL fold metallo-hydrolase, partial [Alphaproteobacteria bacterium]|nr:MBL fold metallo-hydrolase [Alphaproteobacteria bacterium]